MSDKLTDLNHEIDYLTECWLNTNDPNYKTRLDKKILEKNHYEQLQRENRHANNEHNKPTN